MQRLNEALGALLETLASRLDSGAADWAEVMLGQNYGPVPVQPEAAAATGRGFNLLLLGADGRPRHFARCRPGVDLALLEETALLGRLRADPRGRGHVVHAVADSNDSMTVQLAPFASGELLTQYIRSVPPDAASGVIIEVLQAAARLGEIADGDGGALSVDLMEEGAALLDACARAGLEAPRADRLAAVLRAAGTVRSACQHGDLWCANVLRVGERWVLIDLEHFGKHHVPLVDALQITRSAAELRWLPGPESWIARLAGQSEQAAFCRAVLDWARRSAGLGDSEALGAVAFGLLEITARFYTADRRQDMWLPGLESVRAYADLLTDDAMACRLLFGER